MKLDPWQQEVLDTDGHIVLRSGRQVGKSTVISIKSGQYAATNKKKHVLIIASVERQAQLLFEKVMDYLFKNYKSMIKRGKEKPTKSKVCLTNGSIIRCLPTGLSGYGIRGFTVDLLIADEAAFIPEEVWTAVTPMLAVSKGTMILLSTPFGKGGYFYDCFQKDNFSKFHVSSEDCSRMDPEHLKSEKESMTNLQYAQEYLGEFVDELRQFFPTELIKSCMVSKPGETPSRFAGDFFLGVDVARMGGDESVLFAMQRINKKKLIQVDIDVYENSYLTETVKKIKISDLKWNYKKMYIDDGGLGVGVFDPLLEDPQTKRRVVPINNASRSLDNEEKKYKKLLKEDLYNNLLTLMERSKITFWSDPDVLLSLKSVQSEYKNGKLRIFGNYTHIAEAMIRAAWCMKDKTLNIWIA
jgi:hypothetical protein|tara:strand:- start:6155 stop:7390 length:1236 start_codon:yes stop_codon:yes gene_type:complete